LSDSRISYTFWVYIMYNKMMFYWFYDSVYCLENGFYNILRNFLVLVCWCNVKY